MIVQLLTEHHLELLSFKAGCRGSSESTLVKMSHCWKSHALAQLLLITQYILTFCRPMEFSIKFYTVKSGWFIVYIEGSQIII